MSLFIETGPPINNEPERCWHLHSSTSQWAEFCQRLWEGLVVDSLPRWACKWDKSLPVVEPQALRPWARSKIKACWEAWEWGWFHHYRTVWLCLYLSLLREGSCSQPGISFPAQPTCPHTGQPPRATFSLVLLPDISPSALFRNQDLVCQPPLPGPHTCQGTACSPCGVTVAMQLASCQEDFELLKGWILISVMVITSLSHF